MNGYGFYSHKIEFPSNRITALEDLQDIRVWLWENYGPGCELSASRKKGVKWAWDTENGNRRIYINDDILVMVKLKFS